MCSVMSRHSPCVMVLSARLIGSLRKIGRSIGCTASTSTAKAHKLRWGQFELNGLPVKRSNIHRSVLQSRAAAEHIVPYASSSSLVELVSSTDTADVKLTGGHASLIAGRNAPKRRWPQTNQWLSARSVQESTCPSKLDSRCECRQLSPTPTPTPGQL